MATIGNRITMQIITSADISGTTDYPTKYPRDLWLVLNGKADGISRTNAELLAIIAIPRKYRKIVVADMVSMDPGEMAVRDAAILTAQRNALKDQIDNEVLKAVVAGLVDVINLRLPVDQEISYTEVRATIRSQIDG